jgi:hypothetical protein
VKEKFDFAKIRKIARLKSAPKVKEVESSDDDELYPKPVKLTKESEFRNALRDQV